MIVFVGALVLGGTQAFFSDTETSTGNTFTAGDIDLRIGNTSYAFDYNIPGYDDPTGEFVATELTSWQITDLTIERFFDFIDLKPGDYGEDTISIEVGSNDAWVCAAANITADLDNDITEPEDEEFGSNSDDDDGTPDGDLDSELNFAFWVDDGDNVFEDDEEVFLNGSLDGIGQLGPIALADSAGSVLEDDGPVPGGDTFNIGKIWCFGELTEAPLTQDNESDAISPLNGTGFQCDGSAATNLAQTDSVEGDLEFYAVQSRNNGDFQCSEWEPAFIGQDAPRPTVGAALATYVAPESCTATAAGTDSIQELVDSADNGSVICVDSSYDGTGDEFPVTLNVTDLTVAGLGAAGDAEIPGGFFIDANGVTVTGLEFTDYSFIASSEDAAIYIHNEPGQGSATNLIGTTISHNIFTAPGSAKGDLAKGIVTEIGSASAIASGITVTNNTFTDWRQGIFYNTANHDTTFNTFTGNDVGVANDGPESSSIANNNFVGNVLEAVGVASAAIGATSNDGALTVNTNNFGPTGAGNDVNFYLASVFGGADVDATGNWWDGEVEGDRTNNTAEVDTSSPEVSAFPIN
jgi:predicted ribosomally synthesized peptide with SipW-like signal peptide